MNARNTDSVLSEISKRTNARVTAQDFVSANHADISDLLKSGGWSVRPLMKKLSELSGFSHYTLRNAWFALKREASK